MTTEQTVVYVINTTGGAFDLYSNHSTIIFVMYYMIYNVRVIPTHTVNRL